MLFPIVATYIFSVAVRWDRSILPEGYTLEWYRTAFKSVYFGITLRNSMIVSLASVLVSVLVVVPTVYWVHTRLSQAKPLLDLLMILPFGIPTVVLALALVQVFNFPPLARSPYLLVGSTVVFSMPFMYRSVSNAITAIDAHTLTEAAQSLGAGIRPILTEVIIPNILTGILNGSPAGVRHGLRGIHPGQADHRGGLQDLPLAAGRIYPQKWQRGSRPFGDRIYHRLVCVHADFVGQRVRAQGQPGYRTSTLTARLSPIRFFAISLIANLAGLKQQRI